MRFGRDSALIHDSYNCGKGSKMGNMTPWPTQREGFFYVGYHLIWKEALLPQNLFIAIKDCLLLYNNVLLHKTVFCSKFFFQLKFMIGLFLKTVISITFDIMCRLVSGMVLQRITQCKFFVLRSALWFAGGLEFFGNSYFDSQAGWPQRLGVLLTEWAFLPYWQCCLNLS